jgi:hypothetical protein
MQRVRFDRLWDVLLVLGLAGFVGGCGPGAQRVSPDEEKAIQADMRKFYQGVKTKKSEGPSPGGPRRTGRGSGASAP